MKYATETMVVAVGAFLALLGAAFAHDHLFAIHMEHSLLLPSRGHRAADGNAMDFSPAGRMPTIEASGYFDEVIRYGLIATVFWGVVGFLVGVVVALQLAFPDLKSGAVVQFRPHAAAPHLVRSSSPSAATR